MKVEHTDLEFPLDHHNIVIRLTHQEAKKLAEALYVAQSCFYPFDDYNELMDQLDQALLEMDGK